MQSFKKIHSVIMKLNRFVCPLLFPKRPITGGINSRAKDSCAYSMCGLGVALFVGGGEKGERWDVSPLFSIYLFHTFFSLLSSSFWVMA